jgi:hypothetical protein
MIGIRRLEFDLKIPKLNDIQELKGGGIMKNRRFLKYMLIVALGGMIVFLSQGPAKAGVICSPTMSQTTDSDRDGFTDYLECYGLTLKNGSFVPGRANCNGGTNCLDPDNKDLFVILVPATPTSYLPPNSLQLVSNPISQGGLGITVHLIYPTASYPFTDRTVASSSTQKAVRVTESLDTTSPNVLGFSNTGTPNGLDMATIYTQRIINFIKSACGNSYGTSTCADSSGIYDSTGNLALTQKYIIHTIDHEVGHVLGPLAPVYNANYGGYHYKSGTNVIMDQSIYYTSKEGKVTFYIGTGYTAPDQSSAKLK